MYVLYKDSLRLYITARDVLQLEIPLGECFIGRIIWHTKFKSGSTCEYKNKLSLKVLVKSQLLLIVTCVLN